MLNWKLTIVILAVSVAAALLLLAATEHAAHTWFPDVSFPTITWDIWSLIREVLSAIATALRTLITSPFYALANTLMEHGIPLWLAWGVATAIIIGTIAGTVSLVAKLKGWL